MTDQPETSPPSGVLFLPIEARAETRVLGGPAPRVVWTANDCYQLVVNAGGADAVHRLVMLALQSGEWVLNPIPATDPEGNLSLDAPHWPGDDLPTYALHPKT